MLAGLLAPAIAMGRRGRRTRHRGQRLPSRQILQERQENSPIASLGTAELEHASKADNIERALALALARAGRMGNLDESSILHAWEKYDKIAGGAPCCLAA